jgi:hypothetical protein
MRGTTSVEAGLFFVPRCARRGRRYPVKAHGVAVSASLRLRCGARFGLGRLTLCARFARYVQTRSGKSVHEVRFAHRAQSSALAGRTGLCPVARQAQTVHWTVCVRARPRRPTVSPHRAPPAAQARRSQCRSAVCQRLHKAAAGQAPARICGAEHRRVCGRVRSTPREHSCRCMFERNDRREWSEFSDGHEPEKRRGAGAKRRPPHLRAGACPAAALPRQPMHKNQAHWRK